MTKIKCPVCEHTNESGRKECSHCGAPLPQVRVQSGSGNRKGGSEEGQSPQPAPSRGQATFRKGEVVARRYTIVDVVGKGGMGCIYKVYDNTLKEEVALKTLLPQYLRDKMVVDRFFNEARIARQLSHPGIVRVHDIGVADQVLYISMEYLQGKSLRAMLEAQRPGERIPVRTVLQIMIELCTALEYAHQYTVHRDIKPENVMILPDGSVKLMDFGISKLMTNNRLTATAVVMGTPHYMSPEQVRDSSTVDARADIYSIGVMLYEVLTGNLPTGVPKPASQIMRDIPPALDPIVARCVEPDPKLRYANISDLKQALSSVLALVDGGTFDLRKPAPKVARDRGPILRQVFGVGLIAAVLLVTVVGVYGLEARRKRLIAEAAAIEVLPEDPSRARMGEVLNELFDLIEMAEQYTSNVSKTEESERIRTRAAMLKEAAERQRSNPERAVKVARQSLQCFQALALRRDDLYFVPPGDDVSTAAFFIARRPVTVAEFDAWASANWRTYPNISEEALQLPATNLRYYDALAFAAAHGMMLPAKEEWLRAFDANPEMMRGAIREWTRSAASGGEGVPTFGTSMITIGAGFSENGEPLMPETSALNFEGNDPQVGFRCVLPISTDPERIRQHLAR